MQGHSVKLPLKTDPIDGLYNMNKTALDSIKQNLKMLLLTNPGERIMIPDYGVGLKSYLFEQKNQYMASNIENKINQQISKYLNIVKIEQIIIAGNEEIADSENTLNVRLLYSIPLIGYSDELNINFDSI